MAEGAFDPPPLKWSALKYGSCEEDHHVQEETPPEEIVSKLRQVDVLIAQGTPVADAIRAIGVTEMLWADGGEMAPSSLEATPMERPMAQQLDDLSRSLTPLEQDSTIIA